MNRDQRFPVHKAAKTGDRTKLLELLESGIYVDSLDDNESTALHYAAQEGNYDELILLLHFGACINSLDYEGATPLQVAVSNLHIECVEALMNNGADVTILDKRGKDVIDILEVQSIAHWNDDEVKSDINKIKKMLMKKIDPHKRAKIKKFEQQFKNKINNSSNDQNQSKIDDFLGDKEQLLQNGNKISKNVDMEEGRIEIVKKNNQNNTQTNKRNNLSKLDQQKKKGKIKKLQYMAIKTGLMTAAVSYYCIGIFPQFVQFHPVISILLLILVFSEELVYFLLIFAFGSGQVKITSENKMKEYLKQGDLSKVCVTCKTIRPARSKHCGQCGQCVLRFDHHCVWIATDVGQGNHRIFMPYLFNLISNSIIGFVIFALHLKDKFTGQEHLGFWMIVYTLFVRCFFDIFCLGCCAFVFIFMGSTFSEQAWFVAHNITMNEKINQSRYEHFWRGTRFSNPFNRGILKNIREFVLKEDVDYDSVVNAREKERKQIQDCIDKSRLNQQQQQEQQSISQRTQY